MGVDEICQVYRGKGKGRRKDFTGYVKEWLEEYKKHQGENMMKTRGGETLRLPPAEEFRPDRQGNKMC